MLYRNTDTQDIAEVLLKEIIDNDAGSGKNQQASWLNHTESRFYAWIILDLFRDKKLCYSNKTTDKIFFWLELLTKYGFPHYRRSMIAKEVLKLFRQAKAERAEEGYQDIEEVCNQVFGFDNSEF